ncbi:peroxide stress protein YaaA [Corynebacterium aquilae]|uniref:Uncharacterized protein n=1 Tax=Corynebacterium aquilae DSM 44791 TaxID=1431546 RepID=A0A1L7CGL1_9CORY|nr:peroxide stress protein YaaA [Corynebacterium aquilae]APT84976.1 hypothetical protein CAQU_07710 [Corynebacterium aquilae DSM 44791]
MLIVLAPSETKAAGGSGAPVVFDDRCVLSFPELNERRHAIAKDLVALCAGDVEAAAQALKVGPAKFGDVEATAELLSAPTMPAIERYTGVQYDALDAGSLTQDQRQCLAVGSALFGLVRANDPIPFYRLSGGSKVPSADGSVPTMKARWGTAITDVLSAVAADELLVDLRSGTYQQLGKVKDAVTVRVESEFPDGTRKVVSHFNKHYKGLLARELALSGVQCASMDEVAEVAAAAGMRVEVSSGSELTLVVPAS